MNTHFTLWTLKSSTASAEVVTQNNFYVRFTYNLFYQFFQTTLSDFYFYFISLRLFFLTNFVYFWNVSNFYKYQHTHFSLWNFVDSDYRCITKYEHLINNKDLKIIVGSNYNLIYIANRCNPTVVINVEDW